MKVVITLLMLICCLNASSDFLSSWMGNLLPVISNQTLLDLTLPGTHDTMTYDLSDLVSDGADDDSEAISWILHYASELGLTPGDWIRNQSRTQGLNIVDQLNNGIRFIDFRTMYTSGNWYCLHFMQSNQLSIQYLTMIRDWLVAHPNEILVAWISKHGNQCATGNNQYPGVSIPTKRAFWAQIEQLFGGLIVNHSQTPINQTTIKELIARNTRMIFYASDYKEFTNNSSYALDGCLVDNRLCNSLTSEVQNYECELDLFKNSYEIKQEDKKSSKFFLMSMATSSPGSELELSFLIHFINIDTQQLTEECAAVFNIPGMTDYCPPNLLEFSQLTNYYNQISLELAFNRGYGYPNAIYIDAVDVDGTIRTGTQIYRKRQYGVVRYAYVYTLLLANLNYVCQSRPSEKCVELINYLRGQKAMYPYQRWNDLSTGRSSTWPITI